MKKNTQCVIFTEKLYGSKVKCMQTINQRFNVKQILVVAIATISMSLSAQQTSTFDNLTLSPNSYWDGSDLTKGFTSGDAYFSNKYDTTYNYWADGFVYSNQTDTVTAGNPYAAATGRDFSGVGNYAVAQNKSIIRLINNAIGKPVTGFYVTNASYSYISMRDGDQFAKKFGGTSGNDPDWFKLTVFGYYNGSLINDSVEFYLADYRFSNNTQDYRVNTWEWVDLTTFGNLDSLVFSLSSSDVGQWGMNTPAFFCIDEFNKQNVGLAETNKEDKLHLYPNPAKHQVTIINSFEEEAQLVITDMSGKIVCSELLISNVSKINIENVAGGFYLARLSTNNKTQTSRLIILK